jgi:hypothetical protein
MSRRLAPAVLSALALLVAPATALAQAPPDERANARALADIGVRLTAEVEGTLNAWSPEAPACKSDKRLSRATGRQQERVFELYGAQFLGQLGRAIVPAIDRANAAMQAVPTADAALVGGRTAWSRLGRVYHIFASLPHVRLCIEQRNYVRHGFKRTPAMKRALRIMRKATRLDLERLDLMLSAAVERLVELGVPKEDAAAFGGQDPDTPVDVGRGPQALASRPLTAWR